MWLFWRWCLKSNLNLSRIFKESGTVLRSEFLENLDQKCHWKLLGCFPETRFFCGRNLNWVLIVKWNLLSVNCILLSRHWKRRSSIFWTTMIYICHMWNKLMSSNHSTARHMHPDPSSSSTRTMFWSHVLLSWQQKTQLLVAREYLLHPKIIRGTGCGILPKLMHAPMIQDSISFTAIGMKFCLLFSFW